MHALSFFRNVSLGLTLLLPFSSHSQATYDVVIYGGTSAAVAAAVQVKRMGRSVAIVCPDTHLGGLSSGGLGFTDTGDKSVIGGLAREFYHHVYLHYQSNSAWKWQSQDQYGNRGQGTPAIDGQQRTMWIFEPHVAENIFDHWVQTNQIPVFRNHWLNRTSGVRQQNTRITQITMENGASFQAKMFLDATYEGDLLAAAGVSYATGREPNHTYGEIWNGVQKDARHHRHFFAKPISAYTIPGDPISGLLPKISDDPPGENGQGDHRIQAYCYRLCLTQHPSNRIPFPKPPGYNPADYELLLRVLLSGWRETFDKFDPIPNAKTDTNNHGPFSTDNIGMNYDYPDASYARRREILKEHEYYQKGLLYFLANDVRVPEDVRIPMSQWGLAADEFVDNGNWPHQIYVREARRMIGEYVMTDQDCLRLKETPESVGMGSYSIDSHNVQRYVTPEGLVQNEGDIGVSTGGPYKISYRSLVPKKGEISNLLVPVCISSSHAAFGSIRMEPVFMILGQSSATAACLALDHDLAVQDVPYDLLKTRLIADHQVLESTSPPLSLSNNLTLSSLPGVTLDDSQAQKIGSWKLSRSLQGFAGQGYLHDDNSNKGLSRVVYTLNLPESGPYEVRISYTPNANRSSRVPVQVQSNRTRITHRINQQSPPPIQKSWTPICQIFGEKGESITVTILNEGTQGYVVADAVHLFPLPTR